jgi:hypothetical protein
MIILLPSYKRTAILQLVIQSILQCDTTGIDERICVLIVNNYFPNKGIIDDIVAKFDFKQHFYCEVIHREESLPAVESWFNALFDKAYPNEIVMLLGDDDLMLPYALKNRYRAMVDNKADMLISDFYQRVYFSDDGEKYALLTGEAINIRDDPQVTKWEYFASNHQRASFISNHCYRNSGVLKAAFDKAMALSHTQDWVPRAFATGSLPLYMSFTVRKCGGVVQALSEKSVLRGALVSETMSSEYSDGCSTAFYSLLLYQMFHSQDVHDDMKIVESYKNLYLNSIRNSMFTLLTSSPVSFSTTCKTINRAGLRIIDVLRPLLFFKGMILFMLRIIPGIRGFRVKRELRMNSASSTSDLLTMLRSNYSRGSDN